VFENSVLKQLLESTCVLEYRFRTVLETVLQSSWLARTQGASKNMEYFRTAQGTVLRSVKAFGATSQIVYKLSSW